MKHYFPAIDWEVYGWICFSQRAAILKALDRPLQPTDIKRRARMRDERLRMSANNVREIVPQLLRRGLVRPIYERKKAHPRYELTDLGRVCRELLIRAEVHP